MISSLVNYIILIECVRGEALQALHDPQVLQDAAHPGLQSHQGPASDLKSIVWYSIV